MLEYEEWVGKRSQVLEAGVVLMKKFNDYGQNGKLRKVAKLNTSVRNYYDLLDDESVRMRNSIYGYIHVFLYILYF